MISVKLSAYSGPPCLRKLNHHPIVYHDNALCTPLSHIMMTSSNGNIFRVTGPWCGNSPVPGEFPAQRPVTRSFDVFFDLRLHKRLSKQSWGWWFEAPSRPLWRHSNVHWEWREQKSKRITFLRNASWNRVWCMMKNVAFTISLIDVTQEWESFSNTAECSFSNMQATYQIC